MATPRPLADTTTASTANEVIDRRMGAAVVIYFWTFT
jgi:thioredoxin-like negative regulator of GroEL